MQKVNKLRVLVSKKRKSTEVLILENNSAIASPRDMITSCIKQPERGYLGSSCVIWAQPFSLLCVRISLLVCIQRCLDHLCFLFAKESIPPPGLNDDHIFTYLLSPKTRTIAKNFNVNTF